MAKKPILIEVKPGEWAEIAKGKSIRLFGVKRRWGKEDGPFLYETKFVVGDEAEYDSFNLSYTGTIVSITNKTVTIQPPYGDKKKRLKIYDFQWRNWDFDSEETARKNSVISMSI